MRRIWLDGRVHATLDESVPRTGAPQVWKSGFTGKGVKVAVLDTGYDLEHPDLRGLVAAGADFVGEGTVDDGNGHGTHVSSTIAGTGKASGGRYRGMAPDVRLYEGKVLNRFGSGTDGSVLQGMEWAVDQGVDIVNMSLGSAVANAGSDPLSVALNQLSIESGTLFVVSAGNDGDSMTIGSPGAAEEALTVGSVTKQGELSYFSSQGPRSTDLAIKPEIVAPGSDIVAARAAGTYPQAAINAYYSSLSGTSMASPHVAGAAALLAQAHPSWTARQLKAALVGAADHNNDTSPYAQGAGELDVAEAVKSPVVATTARPLTAVLPTTGPISWDLGYLNLSSKQSKLSLDITLADVVTGKAAPQGLVTADQPRLVIPARGSAEAGLEVDVDAIAPGKYAGWAVATGKDVEVRTPISVVVQAPTHQVTLTRPARPAGVSTSFQYTMVQNEETGDASLLTVGNQPRTLTLPEGTYRVFGHIINQILSPSGQVSTSDSTHFATRLIVDGDESLTVDVAGAKPVLTGVSDRDLQPELATTTGVVSRPPGAVGTGLLAPISGPLHQVYVKQSAYIPGVDFLYTGSLASPLITAQIVGADPMSLYLDSATPVAWTGTMSGPLVDAGQASPEQLAALDLDGAIALVTFPYEVPLAERNARMQALANAGVQGVILGLAAVTDESLPLFTIDSRQLPTLVERLAAGPLPVELTGRTFPEEAAFLTGLRKDRLPDGADFRVADADLAHVTTTLPALGNDSYRNYFAAVADLEGLLIASGMTLTIPGEVRVGYTPGVSWQNSITHLLINESIPFGWMDSRATTYAAGQQSSESFLRAPFNPSLSGVGADVQGNPVPYAFRTGDEFRIGLPFWADAAGHTTGNTAGIDTGSVVLRQGRRVVGTNDAVGRLRVEGLPRGKDWYRLEMQGRRTHATWPLSTEVRAEWRFRMGHAPDRPTALPLLDVRYDVPVDLHQSVAAGAPFQITLTAAHAVGSTGGGRAAIDSLRYSLDHGATWRRATLTSGPGGSVLARIPALAAGTEVSLQTTASDRQGGRLVETLLTAFTVAAP